MESPKLLFFTFLDKLHAIFGIKTELLKKYQGERQAEAILALDDGKLKENQAIAVLIQEFWNEERDAIEKIINEQQYEDLSEYIDEINDSVSNLMAQRSQKIEVEGEQRVKDLAEFVKNAPGVQARLDVMSPKENGLLLIEHGIHTAVANTVNALEVYRQLTKKTTVKELTAGTRDFLTAMASLEPNVQAVLEPQLYEGFEERKESGLWFASLMLRSNPQYDKTLFRIDETGRLQLDEKVFKDGIEEYAEVIKKSLDGTPRTKCPALFSVISAGGKKTNAIRDLSVMIAERLSRERS